MTDAPLHYAAAPTSIEAVRDRLAGAPTWVLEAVNQERERRGLSLLTVTSQPATPARPSRLPRSSRSIVGVAAPGLSSPVRMLDRGEALPEFVTRQAWQAVRQELEAGDVIDFVRDHSDRKPFASSDSPDVSISWDPRIGMLFQIRGESAARIPWLAVAQASIGFRPIASTKCFRGGQWVRAIDSMKLVHVCIAPVHHATAIYPAARVRCVRGEDAVRAMLDLRISAANAAREAGL